MISLGISYLKKAVLSTLTVSRRAILSFQVGLFFTYIQKSDFIIMSDKPQKGTTKPRTDSFNVSENLATTVNYDRKPTDSTVLTDSLNSTVDFNREFSNEFAVSDSYSDQVIFRPSFSSGSTFSEDIDYFEVIKSVNDVVSVTDDTNGTLMGDDQVASITKAKQNYFLLTDLAQNDVLKPLTDGFAASTNLANSYFKNLTHSFNVDTNVSSVVSKRLQNVFVTSDSLTTVNTFNRIFENSGTFGDNIYYFETIKVLNNITELVDNKAVEVTKVNSDGFLLSEQLATTNQFFRNPPDTLILADLDPIYDVAKNIGQTVNFSELVNVFLIHRKFFTDVVGVTDDMGGLAVLGDDQLITLIKALSNNTRFTDKSTNLVGKKANDNLGISSLGLASVQNYTGNYFSADYVGSSRAFT